jgi:hypothetical protein
MIKTVIVMQIVSSDMRFSPVASLRRSSADKEKIDDFNPR